MHSLTQQHGVPTLFTMWSTGACDRVSNPVGEYSIYARTFIEHNIIQPQVKVNPNISRTRMSAIHARSSRALKFESFSLLPSELKAKDHA